MIYKCPKCGKIYGSTEEGKLHYEAYEIDLSKQMPEYDFIKICKGCYEGLPQCAADFIRKGIRCFHRSTSFSHNGCYRWNKCPAGGKYKGKNE